MISRRLGLILRWLLIVGALWSAFGGVLMGYIYSYGQVDRAQKADVIVVLGSGLIRGYQIGPSLYLRTRHSARLYHQGYALYVLCTGGQGPREKRSEASACAEALHYEFGVPKSAILLEELSRSTEENAIESQKVMAQQGFNSALVVTQGYHILRAEYLFKRYGITASFSPVPDDPYNRTSALVREVVAWHWQIFKDALGLPITYFP